jgi:hypothetical protein
MLAELSLFGIALLFAGCMVASALGAFIILVCYVGQRCPDCNGDGERDGDFDPDAIEAACAECRRFRIAGQWSASKLPEGAIQFWSLNGSICPECLEKLVTEARRDARSEKEQADLVIVNAESGLCALGASVAKSSTPPRI